MKEKDFFPTKNKLYIVMVCIFVLLFIAYELFDVWSQCDADKLPSKALTWGEKYVGTWTVSTENGVMEQDLIVPFDSCDGIEKGEDVWMSTVLPETLKDDTVFCLYTGRNTVIYIDDVERYSFSMSEDPFPGGMVKSIMIQVQLTSEDAGKTLTLCKSGERFINGGLSYCYIGNTTGVFENLFYQFGYKFLLSLLLFIFAAIMIVVGCWQLFAGTRSPDIVLLGLGFLFTAMWEIYDNPFYQPVMGVYFAEGILEYLLVMLIPIPFALFLNIQQHRRYEKHYAGIMLADLILLMVVSGLHFGNIASFYETQTVMNVFLAIILFSIAGTIILDMVRRKSKEYRDLVIGLLGFFICGILDIVFINIFPTLSDGYFILAGLYFLLAMSTIHISKQVKAANLEAQKAVETAKLKSAFLANMSHEIRTPINAIMGMDEIILRDPKSDEVADCASNIMAASENLLSLVNDILDFSKIDAGKMELVEGNYSLGQMLKRTQNMMEVRTQAKGLALEVNVDRDIPDKLFGDDMKLQQILINLMNNAVKYTDAGKVTLAVKGKQEADRVLLTMKISDTGIGIKPEDQKHLFEEFTRTDMKHNKYVEGSGLGLAITAKLIKLMGGDINVKSVYGEGSVFTVHVTQPVKGTEKIGDFSNVSVEVKKEENKKEFTAPDAQVLVVDDNAMNLKVAVGLLKATQIKIDTVESGKGMLDLVGKKKYDVILLDHMMPEMDGMETLKRFRELQDNPCVDTPVIAMTANAIKGSREIYLEAGFDDYLSKPVKRKDLEAMLLKYIPEEKIIYTI